MPNALDGGRVDASQGCVTRTHTRVGLRSTNVSQRRPLSVNSPVLLYQEPENLKS